MIVIAIAMSVGSSTKAHAQVGNPFWPYTGIGTMMCMDGVYYGWIYMGFAQGEGYYYFYDGSVFHGYFKAGRPHGRGEVLTCIGYIAGEWNNGQFVRCVSMPQQQIQNYYQQA